MVQITRQSQALGLANRGWPVRQTSRGQQAGTQGYRCLRRRRLAGGGGGAIAPAACTAAAGSASGAAAAFNSGKRLRRTGSAGGGKGGHSRLDVGHKMGAGAPASPAHYRGFEEPAA